MYPTGWKFSEGYESATTGITEFATGLQAPTDLIIPCEGFSFCLFAIGKEGVGADSAIIEIWGTQTDGEAAQQIKFCFNSRLCTVTTVGGASVNESVLDIGAKAADGTPVISISTLTMTDQESGAEDATSSARTIGALHFWNRLAGNQTTPGYMDSAPAARSADDPNSTKLWHYPGTSADGGLSWVAIPCGPFNYLQVEVSVPDGDTTSVFYNLLT